MSPRELTGVLLCPHTAIQERNQPAGSHEARRRPKQVHGEAVRLRQGTSHSSREVLLKPGESMET